MLTFDDQIAVVTGGAQGIGAEVVKNLCEHNASVAIWDKDYALAQQTASVFAPRCIALPLEIADWSSVESAFEQTVTQLGAVSILVNSAGIAGSNAPVHEYNVEEFQHIVAVNLTGTFHVNKVVIPAMRKMGYGRIVNIASVAGKEGNPNASAYSASKAGVIGLTKSLGKENADLDIAVNCVTPAAARTRIFDQMSQEHIDYMLSKIPRGRFLELSEAAALINWLVSKENSFTTAGTFDLSGGRATY